MNDRWYPAYSKIFYEQIESEFLYYCKSLPNSALDHEVSKA